MIKIIFFDIDGTLRPFETGIIPESARNAVRKAHEAGIVTAIATGRHWMELYNENLIEGMRFEAFVTQDGEYCYILPPDHVDRAVEAGAHLHHVSHYQFEMQDPVCYFDPRYGTIVQKIEIPKDQIQKVLALCEQKPFACLFQEERQIYANMVTPELLEVLYDIKTHQPPVVDPKRALDPEHPVFMLIPVMSMEESLLLEKELPDCDLVRWSDGLSFDLTKKCVSKVSGIDAVLSSYGFQPQEAAAIGDGWNDIGMLQHCGLGIAMGNAKEECKSAADYICPSIHEDGVAHAIDYILSLQNS